MTAPAMAAAECAARDSYGRLLAFLAGRSRDLAAAEDALADAFERALRTWPRDGVPDRPEAWLLTVARRLQHNTRRNAGVGLAAGESLAILAEAAQAEAETTGFPDERLKLLFLCAHPAIDAAIRTPLMLQTVLGLNAQQIGAAFMVAPAAMGQRLVRAKAKIRDAGIAFATPALADLQERLQAVLEAVFAAYGTAWQDATGTDPMLRDLSDEALFLARLLAELLPQEPEALGLLSLILHSRARQAARRDASGAFVPLQEQDTRLWDAASIKEAEAHLLAAASLGRPGRFQLEAAIQSAHADRARSGVTPWHDLLNLYEALMHHAPTLGAALARAVCVGEVHGAAAALAAMAELAGEAALYQPFWAARAHWQARAGHPEAARSYEEAIRLARDPALQAFLRARQALTSQLLQPCPAPPADSR